MLEKTNLLGVIVAHAIYLLCIGVSVSRLAGKPEVGRLGFGIPLLLLALPLAYLLLKAPQLQRPLLYYIQIILMLLFLLVELLLDYVYKIEFRDIKWVVIGYVVLFFAGAGGMLGVASQGGRPSVTAIILFLIMAVLVFVQRAVTGL